MMESLTINETAKGIFIIRLPNGRCIRRIEPHTIWPMSPEKTRRVEGQELYKEAQTFAKELLGIIKSHRFCDSFHRTLAVKLMDKPAVRIKKNSYIHTMTIGIDKT